MNAPLFLFCGGPSIDGNGRPKPLMKVQNDLSLIIYYLHYLKNYRQTMPTSITLLCDDGQEEAFAAEVRGFPYPVPILVKACGYQVSTFHKFEKALKEVENHEITAQFGYPDIFFFGKSPEPVYGSLDSDSSVYISAAPLTSRFPRLVVDVYNSEIKGISDYRSPVPANPMHVFGGDLWGVAGELLELVAQFKQQVITQPHSLEYDFFFWLINHKKMRCVMLYGDRIWVDSIRDIHNLLARFEVSDEIL